MIVKNIGHSVCTVVGNNGYMKDVRPGDVVEIEKKDAAPFLAAGVFEAVVPVVVKPEPEKIEPVHETKRGRYHAPEKIEKFDAVEDLEASDDL